MKIAISMITACCFYFSGFSQAITNYDLPPLPSSEEISRQLHEILELKKRSRGNSVSFKETVILNDSIIKTLTPMVFMSVSPAPNDPNIMCVEVLDDAINLWSSNGYYFPWRYDPLRKGYRGIYNLSIVGNSERTANIRDQINQLLPTDVLYSIFPLKSMRWYYHFVGTLRDGQFVIKDSQNNTYSTLQDVILSLFGSWDNYVKEYNKK